MSEHRMQMEGAREWMRRRDELLRRPRTIRLVGGPLDGKSHDLKRPALATLLEGPCECGGRTCRAAYRLGIGEEARFAYVEHRVIRKDGVVVYERESAEDWERRVGRGDWREGQESCHNDAAAHGERRGEDDDAGAAAEVGSRPS